MALDSNTQYGVTPQGFVRMRLPEIKNRLFDWLDEEIGQKVSRKPNSVFGILVGLMANESDIFWELAEKDYYDRSPVSASDGSIDNTLAYTSIVRREAEPTYMYLVCYGRNEMILPANCQVRGDTGERYDIDGMSLITLEKCVSCTLAVKEVIVGREYVIILDDDLHVSYVAEEGDTAPRILAQLMLQVKGDWSAKVTDGNLVLDYYERRYGGKVVPSELFNIVQVGSPVKFIAQETGAFVPPIGSVKTINTPYDGWYSVNNESDAYAGSDRETATEVRQRYAAAVFNQSVSMKESIKAALLELQDVQSVVVIENRQDVVDENGLKPHSYEVTINGGDNTEIAQTILKRGPLGIDTNGNIEMIVEDQEGTEEKIYFRRPTKIPVHVKIIVHEYLEENLPGDMVGIIKEIVVEEGNKLEMGKDVIAQRFLGPIYKQVTGIGYMDIEVSRNGFDYTDKSVAMERTEVATFDVERVTVALEI